MRKVLKVIFKSALAALFALGCVLLVVSLLRNGAMPAPQGNELAERAETPHDPDPLEKADGDAPPQPAPPEEKTETEPVAPPASDREVVLTEFEQILYDSGEDKEKATITGDRAVYNSRQKTYNITSPVLVTRVQAMQDGEEGPAASSEVIVRAKRATFSDSEAGKVVHFIEAVRGESRDVEVETSNVTYSDTDRLLKSDAPVKVRRYHLDAAGQRTLSLQLTGERFAVDTTLEKLHIMRNVVMQLFNVSQDFLAGGAETLEGSQKGRDVTVRSDGGLIYDSPARSITFENNVRVNFGSGALRCDELAIALGKSKGKDSVQVSSIVATGHVVLTHEAMTAKGEKLQWQNVTQTCVLSGEPSTLQTRDFTLSGGTLRLFRLNSRFQIDGPGSLIWKPSPKPDAAPAAEKPDPGKAADKVNPLGLALDEPIQVNWQGSMTFDRGENRASFNKEVLARQGTKSLKCESLSIEFAEDNRNLTEMVAEGGVKVLHPRGEATGEAACHRMVWNSDEGTVRLLAEKGGQVKVSDGTQELLGAELIFNQKNQVVTVPSAGSLTVIPPAKQGQQTSKPPITVQWQGDMKFSTGAERVCTFSGGVQALSEQGRLSSRSLVVHFDKDTSPAKLTASGDAVLEDVKAHRDEGAEETAKNDKTQPKASDAIPRLPDLKQGMTSWRLSSHEIVVEPPKNTLSCPAAGSLVLTKPGGPADTIQWTKQMIADAAQSFASFEGKVKAHFSGAVLSSKKLRLDFNKARQLRHVKAEGDVELTQPESARWKVNCGSAEAIFAADNVLSEVIARDAVRIVDNEITLTAGILTVFFKNIEGVNKAARAEARGKVFAIHRKGETPVTARGDLLKWNRETGFYEISGKPHAELQMGRIKQQAQTILVNPETGRMHVPKGGEPIRTRVTREGG